MTEEMALVAIVANAAPLTPITGNPDQPKISIGPRSIFIEAVKRVIFNGEMVSPIPFITD